MAETIGKGKVMAEIKKVAQNPQRMPQKRSLDKATVNVSGNFSSCPICFNPLIAKQTKFGEIIIYCKKCKRDFYSLSYK